MKRISVMLILVTAFLAGCSSVSSTSSESLSVQESVLTSTVEQESETMINEEEKVLAVYKSMQQAMIDKDTDALDRLYRDGTTFTHLFGKTQTKEEFFGEIADGTLNYFAYDIHDPQITVDGDEAALTASVTLTAKVYSASGSWTLPVNAHFTKTGGQWIAHN